MPTLIVAMLALAALSAAAEDRRQPTIRVESLNPWTHLDLANDPEHFQFAIVTDRTGGHRPGVSTRALPRPGLCRWKVSRPPFF